MQLVTGTVGTQALTQREPRPPLPCPAGGEHRGARTEQVAPPPHGRVTLDKSCPLCASVSSSVTLSCESPIRRSLGEACASISKRCSVRPTDGAFSWRGAFVITQRLLPAHSHFSNHSHFSPGIIAQEKFMGFPSPLPPLQGVTLSWFQPPRSPPPSRLPFHPQGRSSAVNSQWLCRGRWGLGAQPLPCPPGSCPESGWA